MLALTDGGWRHRCVPARVCSVPRIRSHPLGYFLHDRHLALVIRPAALRRCRHGTRRLPFARSRRWLHVHKCGGSRSDVVWVLRPPLSSRQLERDEKLLIKPEVKHHGENMPTWEVIPRWDTASTRHTEFWVVARSVSMHTRHGDCDLVNDTAAALHSINVVLGVHKLWTRDTISTWRTFWRRASARGVMRPVSACTACACDM